MNREYDNSLMNFSKYLWNIFCLWVCPDPFSQYRLSKNVCSAVQWYLNFFYVTFPVMNYASGTDRKAVPCISSKQATNVSKEVQFESEISVFSIFCGWIILWKVIQKNQVIFHEEVLKFRCELTYCNGYSSFNGYISDVKNNWKYICP